MTRRIIVAPDSFKGTIGARDAAEAIALGWRDIAPDDDLVLLPMADGGEGTIEAFAAAVPGARRMPVEVTGPDGRVIRTAWLLLPPSPDAPNGTAVLELAATSGIELLGQPPQLLPFDAHTRGLGQAIADALDHQVSRIAIGLGGSSSTDGGIGALAELGALFSDAAGTPVADGARGLLALAAADLTGLRAVPVGGVQILSDVANPLTGPLGAAAVFGPQKGLMPDDITDVDDALARLADLLGVDPATPGTGAAGGTTCGLLAWGATLVSGAEAVADLIGLDAALAGADLVITGEGAFDQQSEYGKAPGQVIERARRAGVAPAVVAGYVNRSEEWDFPTIALTELAGSREASMADPARWLREAGRSLAATSASPPSAVV